MRFYPVAMLLGSLMLAACSAETADDRAASAAKTVMPASAPSGATVVPVPAKQTEPSGAAPGEAMAGWYRAGTFRPCGSAKIYQVSETADIDAGIRAGDMSAADPVYVRLEGSVANGVFNVSRVAQVGSAAPVRDCPMTGTDIQ